MRFGTLLDMYRKATGAFAFACLTGIVIVTSIQVISRYALQHALFWPEEAARFLLIMITFLVAGLSYERGEMIGITAATQLLGPRGARICAVLVNLSVLVLLLILVRYGWSFARMNAIQKAAALQISMFWIYLAVPVGLSILALHVFGSLVRSVTILFSRKDMAT